MKSSWSSCFMEVIGLYLEVSLFSLALASVNNNLL